MNYGIVHLLGLGKKVLLDIGYIFKELENVMLKRYVMCMPEMDIVHKGYGSLAVFGFDYHDHFGLKYMAFAL